MLDSLQTLIGTVCFVCSELLKNHDDATWHWKLVKKYFNTYTFSKGLKKMVIKLCRSLIFTHSFESGVEQGGVQGSGLQYKLLETDLQYTFFFFYNPMIAQE